MNAKQCADLAQEHYGYGNKDLALCWSIDAVVKLANAEQEQAPAALNVVQIKMTADDAEVYAEAMKTLALLRAKYGSVTL